MPPAREFNSSPDISIRFQLATEDFAERNASLSVTVERNDSRWLIRLEGDVNMLCAAELKGLLLDGLAGGKELQLDLEGVHEIDITILQLLWIAERDAARASSRFVIEVSPAAASQARDAGFEHFPGVEAPQAEE
jgi:anti-anti-sigma regulatory factor